MRWVKWSGIIAMSLSIVLLLATLLPAPVKRVSIPLSKENSPGGSITLSYPTWQWEGDKREVTALIQLNTLERGAASVTLTARLETAAEQVTPRGDVNLGLQSAGVVKFTWEVGTYHQSDYPGTLWIFLTDENSQDLLLSRDFLLHSRALPGLEMRRMRIALGVIAFFGLLLLAFSLILPVLGRKNRILEN